MSGPNDLPIDRVLPELCQKLANAPAVVLKAPTGAGKTTRVPPALLEAGLAGDKQVVVLEPRRVAARAAARRMAAEKGSELGQEVGYRIRFERREGPKTRLLVVTEGILVAMLQEDPFLEKVGAVVLDEFHERNLASDLSLAMARRVQQEVRDDLKIVVMSATLDPGPIAAYLGRLHGGQNVPCPIIESEGRLYPVEIRYLERPDDRPPPAQAAAGARRALKATDGDVLVFLPGVGEIQRTAEALRDLKGTEVMMLYGDLPSEQQDAVLRRGPRRKVVLATNVAETSVTIDGVTAVVDTGLARVLRFDPSSGLDRLELGRISRMSADQRTGRAGRQAPGICLRLWTEHDDRSLQDNELPEIRRVDLAGPVLQLLAWGENDPAAFEWLEPPKPAALDRALELLRALGALDGNGLTLAGRQMARLPLHPRLARLLTAGHATGETRHAALAAALLSERDIVERRPGLRPTAAGSGPSDILDRLDAVLAFERGGYGETALGPVHRGRARRLLRVAQDLERTARRLGKPQSDLSGNADESLSRALLAAYPDRVARRRAPGSDRAVMVGGRGVRLSDASVVRDAELFVGLDLGGGRRRGQADEAEVRLASAIELDWLPEALRRETREAELATGRERAVAHRRSWYLDLLLDEVEVAATAEEAEAVLAEAAAQNLANALGLDRPEVASFLARLRFLNAALPERNLPLFNEDTLRELLPTLCAGKRSLAELRRSPLVDMIKGTMDYQQLQALDRHAPERLAVPSGSQIRLRYENEGHQNDVPVLAVRIQEIFGMAETPRVADGRVPVLLHLLAPNMRPQQVTRDLASFWKNTYPEVRKELKGRYPKHAWPEDPSRATAERRPRRRSR